jgi:MFS family permease
MGSLIDRFHVTTCLLLSSIGATVGTFLLWGFSTSLPVLYIFCITYGLFAGSFSSTYPGIIKDVLKKSDTADAGLVFAFLAAGRGIGNVVSGPLSEALVKGRPWWGKAGMAYGSGFGPLIAFTGASAACGALGFVVRCVGWQ